MWLKVMEGLQNIDVSGKKIFVGFDSQNNSFGASRRFVYTGSNLLRFRRSFGKCFPSEVAKSDGRFAKYLHLEIILARIQ